MFFFRFWLSECFGTFLKLSILVDSRYLNLFVHMVILHHKLFKKRFYQNVLILGRVLVCYYIFCLFDDIGVDKYIYPD